MELAKTVDKALDNVMDLLDERPWIQHSFTDPAVPYEKATGQPIDLTSRSIRFADHSTIEWRSEEKSLSLHGAISVAVSGSPRPDLLNGDQISLMVAVLQELATRAGTDIDGLSHWHDLPGRTVGEVRALVAAR